MSDTVLEFGIPVKAVIALCMFWILLAGVCAAQGPSGAIAGVVRDLSGGVIAAAPVQGISAVTGQVRTKRTGGPGECLVLVGLVGVGY